MIHIMKYSPPSIYNSLRDLARHMQQPPDKQMKVIDILTSSRRSHLNVLFLFALLVLAGLCLVLLALFKLSTFEKKSVLIAAVIESSFIARFCCAKTRSRLSSQFSATSVSGMLGSQSLPSRVILFPILSENFMSNISPTWSPPQGPQLTIQLFLCSCKQKVANFLYSNSDQQSTIRRLGTVLVSLHMNLYMSRYDVVFCLKQR